MYVKPDSLDKTHANYTYMKIRTCKNATFVGAAIPRNLDIYRRNPENRQKIIKNELLHGDVLWMFGHFSSIFIERKGPNVHTYISTYQFVDTPIFPRTFIFYGKYRANLGLHT